MPPAQPTHDGPAACPTPTPRHAFPDRIDRKAGYLGQYGSRWHRPSAARGPERRWADKGAGVFDGREAGVERQSRGRRGEGRARGGDQQGPVCQPEGEGGLPRQAATWPWLGFGHGRAGPATLAVTFPKPWRSDRTGAVRAIPAAGGGRAGRAHATGQNVDRQLGSLGTLPTDWRNGSTALALCCTMPDRDRLTRKRWLLRCKLADTREQAVEHRRRAAWWREKVRAAGEETAQAIARSRNRMEAGRRGGPRSQPLGRTSHESP
jgi:hypothetical protein